MTHILVFGDTAVRPYQITALSQMEEETTLIYLKDRDEPIPAVIRLKDAVEIWERWIKQ